MKRRWRVTPLGWVVITILAACALLVSVTGDTVRFVAAAVAVLIMLMLASEGMSGGGDVVGSAGRKPETLRRNARDIDDR
jgi:hypothetical protein